MSTPPPGPSPSATAPSTYYELLGLVPSADQEEIKHAFKQYAKRWHPDVNPAAEASERFRLGNEAHATLANPALRQLYDVRLGQAVGASLPGFDELVKRGGRSASQSHVAQYYRLRHQALEVKPSMRWHTLVLLLSLPTLFLVSELQRSKQRATAERVIVPIDEKPTRSRRFW